MIKLFIIGINMLLFTLCMASFVVMQEVQCIYAKEMVKVKNQ